MLILLLLMLLLLWFNQKNIRKPNQLLTARNYKVKLKIRSWKPQICVYHIHKQNQTKRMRSRITMNVKEFRDDEKMCLEYQVPVDIQTKLFHFPFELREV